MTIEEYTTLIRNPFVHTAEIEFLLRTEVSNLNILAMNNILSSKQIDDMVKDIEEKTKIIKLIYNIQ